MRAGLLGKRITIQVKSITQSDSGQEVVSWVTIATVWAQKIENRGAERFAARQIVGHAVRTFRFRWSNTVAVITSAHQIVCDGLTYDITDVREVGDREGIEVDCYTASEQAVVA